ncbi:PTS system mannose/fructose/sorbose family transporter subunit IID [Eubacteriales bacterium OttesenSCG-928-N14]|nr:PTS system mannose/fructose/sorbose family transporter subunit IID [Eubacteriales bacterium OttesenSCG-928-N14]
MSEIKQGILDKWTLFKVWFFSTTYINSLTTYPRYYGIGFTAGLLPALKKLYADKPDELIDAMQVYGESYYLAEPMTGLAVTAIVLRMEEERAAGGDISRETINNFKLGIMGGLTGFGDTIFTSTLRPLAMAIFTPMALQGNIMGPLGFLLFKGCARYGNSIFWYITCYRLGRNALGSLMKRGTGLLHRLTEGTVVLSMIVMGAMVARYVNPSFALSWTNGETVTSLQSFFDAALPGFLPLITVFSIYFMMKKNLSVTKIILIFLALSIVGSLIGLFA